MLRAVLTSPYGVKSDISLGIENLLAFGEYADFRDTLTTRYITDLGHKLVQAGGLLAPGVVLVAIERHMAPEYAAYVGGIWRLDDMDEADIDEEGLPTLAISGPPPTGRLRSAG